MGERTAWEIGRPCPVCGTTLERDPDVPDCPWCPNGPHGWHGAMGKIAELEARVREQDAELNDDAMRIVGLCERIDAATKRAETAEAGWSESKRIGVELVEEHAKRSRERDELRAALSKLSAGVDEFCGQEHDFYELLCDPNDEAQELLARLAHPQEAE